MGSDHCPITLELNLDLDPTSKYNTPKCAGNLRPEFKQKGISSFFSQAQPKKAKRSREEEGEDDEDAKVICLD